MQRARLENAELEETSKRPQLHQQLRELQATNARLEAQLMGNRATPPANNGAIATAERLNNLRAKPSLAHKVEQFMKDMGETTDSEDSDTNSPGTRGRRTKRVLKSGKASKLISGVLVP